MTLLINHFVHKKSNKVKLIIPTYIQIFKRTMWNNGKQNKGLIKNLFSIFNLMLDNHTDCVFWAQYPMMTDVDAFRFNINMCHFLEQLVSFHHNQDFLTYRAYLMLLEIFTEVSQYNMTHGTDLTMGQIIAIISSRL